jgi:myo-inositol 2-dehydrogenase/D-chiro-inositol 1-dehydrogenase
MIELALLGAGRIGRVHARAISMISDAHLKYVFDPMADASQMVVDAYGAISAPIEDILDDSEVDGVLICTPSDQHADQIKQAIKAGKAVFCEKPISTDLDTTRQVLEVVDEHQGCLMLGFQRRFDSHFMALKAKLAAEAVGSLEQLLIISRDPSPPPYSYMRASGGLFKDMMIHDFDMARWLVDEKIVSVYATGGAIIDEKTRTEGKDIDTASVLMTTETNKQITIINSRRASVGYDQRVEAHCSNATLNVNSMRETNLVVADASGIAETPLENFFMTRYQDAYRREIEHFVSCVQSSSTPLVLGLDGMEALVLAESASTSFSSGYPVKVD